MDLAGAKLRTAGLPPGPSILRINPFRDDSGRVLMPASVWLTPQEQPQPAPANSASTLVSLALPAAWLRGLQANNPVRFRDRRGRKRKLRVLSISEQGCWAELRKTAYLAPDTLFWSPAGEAMLQRIPRLEAFLLLRPGDVLQLNRYPGALDSTGTQAAIGCTMPELLDHVKLGERVWFDDGKIGGVVEQVEPDALLVRITQARAKGEKLRNDKGINLPDSLLPLPALTPKDQEDLAFIAQHADMVGLSFASRPQDVELLQQRLAQLTERPIPFIIKVETQRGFEQLPAILLTAMRAPGFGVMIARGDLAVECGFERLAEVQEEILWLCEAAHVPVIWATQVLESLASGGLPSRAEITDAAMGNRAECVMLNKGPRVVQAVETLDGIFRRMQGHQHKKSAMLRSLHVAQMLPEPESTPL
ncbi:pyruvate kinase [Hymenobacter sedentarius]|uniref:pyruvate kinase n=1 Tax=Hymenobacter sedentarius TaxID=1411621 RepID=UPI000A6135B5|nr:pyruvate kinase [Hymenobacter sedentarius]